MAAMLISVRNCNNIDNATIEIVENVLNIFYAINGTGKSTIAKAIASKNEKEAIEKLTPFKCYNSEEGNAMPQITGIEDVDTIGIFNEEYVSQYVFKTEEVIQNSFEIFVKTPDYDERLSEINELIKDAKNTFAEHNELDELLADMTVFIEGYGKAQSGYSAAGSIGKAFGHGNKIYNVPPGLSPYEEYLKNEYNSKWLGWHLSGKDYVDIAEKCPYCATKTTLDTKTAILKISEEFDVKSIEHLNKMLAVFEKLSIYFSSDTNELLDIISKNLGGISPEQKNLLLEVKSQAVAFKDKLWKIKCMSFESLKDTEKVISEVSQLKVDIRFFIHFNSENTMEKIGIINNALDIVIQKATTLQAAIGKQNSLIKKTISKYSNEINSFLKYAGYKYEIILEPAEQGSYKMKLKHIDSAESISKADIHLSFGEKNAFALILFMYQTIKSNPDLIILDDPISSFDGNKKFAILNKLFRERNSFRDKTVVLLTHEFSTVIDIVYNLSGRINNSGSIKATAVFLENHSGELVSKAIDKGKIRSFPVIARENVINCEKRISKLIYLRRLFEINENKSNAWQLLSNMFKDGRIIPLYKVSESDEREMSQSEIDDGTSEIRKYIPDFEYNSDYVKMQDKFQLLVLYKESANNYEKLQIYRLINNSNHENNVIKKFVNETFHVENDYLFQLNPLEYEIVPSYVIDECDADLNKLFPKNFINPDCEDANAANQRNHKKIIPLYEMPASAGIGHWIDDLSYIDFSVDNLEADYAARISGNSMEPDIPNESIVLVKIDPNIQDGETGIFNLNGEIFCKELREGNLVSRNLNYKPIIVSEFDDCRPQGKIIEVIPPSSQCF